VLSAIDLNDKQPVDAYEVEVVAVEWSLPTKVVAEFVQTLEATPQPDFWLGHLVAKAASPSGRRGDQS
jgi:hypothetical protein